MPVNEPTFAPLRKKRANESGDECSRKLLPDQRGNEGAKVGDRRERRFKSTKSRRASESSEIGCNAQEVSSAVSECIGVSLQFKRKAEKRE
jgi:hypothetical protein